MQNGLDTEQVGKAVRALLSYSKKQKGGQKMQLIEANDLISLQVSLFKVPEKPKSQPYQIAIPHSLYLDSDGDMQGDMCFIVKEKDKAAFKDKLQAEPVQGLTKVLGLQKLRTDYHTFGQKRELLAQYDLFFADDRIAPMLPKALGKAFYSRKRQPIPVRTSKGNIANALRKARDSTHLFLGTGDCCMVKIANTGMTEEQIVANIVAGMRDIAKKLPRKWKSVQSIHLKTHDSVALPMYNALPEANLNLSAPAGGATPKEEAPAAVKGKQGQKRAASSKAAAGGADKKGKAAAKRPRAEAAAKVVSKRPRSEAAAGGADKKGKVAAKRPRSARTTKK
jgi:hypothetical protein